MFLLVIDVISQAMTPVLPTATSPAKTMVSPMSSYLQQRANDSLLCLYTFNASSSSFIPSEITTCPFGDLAVASPVVQHLAPRYGVYIGNAASPLEPQLVSTRRARALTFYRTAVVNGMTFELVLRVYKPLLNVNMNVFAIASPFDDCTNPGFRLEISDRQLLVLIFYSLQPTGGTRVCFEQSFYSMTEVDGPCQVPVGTRETPPPLVHVFASIIPQGGASWTTNFLVSYVDAATGAQVTCAAYNSMGGSSGQADTTNTTGAYTLYVGNNARIQVTRPSAYLPRVLVTPTPGPTVSPAVLSLLTQGADRLEMLLPASGGFFFAINGNKVVDVDGTGIAFGRNGTRYGLLQLKELAARAFDKLSALHPKKNATLVAMVPNATSVDWARHPPQARYPPPNASAHMEVFFLAIAARGMNFSALAARATAPLPHLGLGLNVSRRVLQDSATTLRLDQVGGNDPTAAVKLLALPARGVLTTCTAPVRNVTLGDVLVDCCVIFVPAPGETNANMPLANKYDIRQRQRPYATIEYALAASLPFKYATTLQPLRAAIAIFVDAAPATAPPPKPSTPIVLVAPPYAFSSAAKYRESAFFTVTLDLFGDDDNGTVYRASLAGPASGGQLAVTVDGLASPVARHYCPFDPRLDALCLARDNGSSGVTFEIRGVALSPTRVAFRGTLRQLQRALTNVSLTNWRHAPHTATIAFALAPLDGSTPAARALRVRFTYGDDPTPAPCTNVLGVLPLCAESFANGAVLATMGVVAATAAVYHATQAKAVATRRKLSAKYQVATAAEFNGILDQLLRVFLEPDMEAPVWLWSVCRCEPEQRLCLETLTVILSLTQSAPRFLIRLRDPVDVRLWGRFLCKFLGRSWFACVWGETVADNSFLRALRRHMLMLPVEIVVLAGYFGRATVLLEWLLVPALKAVQHSDAEECRALLETDAVDAVLAAMDGCTQAYTPETREPCVGVVHRDLIEHVLSHLYYLCAEHVRSLVNEADAAIDGDIPPTGIRLRDIVLALGPPPINLHGFLAITKPGLHLDHA
ncbi:hypothetical protein ACHHYP_14104 [Achlya hypogyna]|uniref:Uncharacterized protein n=1 Tax=Achlya hypogyna TaxID=1202772 RepID=A0A1V9YE04_ACHHY|nr:hypothetical protein ACHHYP_14104 [Achlya hypogyna]